jgi:hypothetical protein
MLLNRRFSIDSDTAIVLGIILTPELVEFRDHPLPR